VEAAVRGLKPGDSAKDLEGLLRQAIAHLSAK
jgi:hypothetical protein